MHNMKSVFNKEKGLDFTKQPMFFGEDLQIQRYDTMTVSYTHLTLPTNREV